MTPPPQPVDHLASTWWKGDKREVWLTTARAKPMKADLSVGDQGLCAQILDRAVDVTYDPGRQQHHPRSARHEQPHHPGCRLCPGGEYYRCGAMAA